MRTVEASRPADEPLRVAVVGLGDISGVHLEAIASSPAGTLVAVADTDPGRAARVGEERGVASDGSLEEMLDRALPDVVHVCTPHHLHVSMATSCLERDVHVLLEKPLASTVADAQALCDVVGRSSAQLGLCLQNRYNTASRALHDLVTGGSLPPPHAGRPW